MRKLCKIYIFCETQIAMIWYFRLDWVHPKILFSNFQILGMLGDD